MFMPVITVPPNSASDLFHQTEWKTRITLDEDM